jgi:hypothetical protein
LGGYTSKRRPVKLVWSADFQFVTDAIAFERQLKGWSRAKKEALMKGNFAELSNLARRRSSSFETAASASALRATADKSRPPQDEERRFSQPQPKERTRSVSVSKKGGKQ